MLMINFSLLVFQVVLARKCSGSLSLSTLNQENIPTDGSGRILVTDIGRNNLNALLCRSTGPTTATTSDWYYHPTSLSLDSTNRIIVDDEQRKGWTRNRDVASSTVRLLHNETVSNPVEGVFTCEIEEDPDSPITVGIYYAITVDVYVEVLSARERSFTVTCTARGGTVLNSSLTGPGVNHTLNLVGAKNMRGDDTYMVTTRPISGGVNGDTYKCVATNGAAVLDSNGEPTDPSDSESLNVASPPIIELVEQTSATAVRVEWSQPPGGATVTGYVVLYTDGIIERSLRLPAHTFATEITQLARNKAYTISVEATSLQLSGVSYTMDVLVSDEQLTLNNSTKSTSEDKDIILVIAITAAASIVMGIVGLCIVTVLCVRRKSACGKPMLKKKDSDNRTEKNNFPTRQGTGDNMTPNPAYDFIASYDNNLHNQSHVPSLQKLTKEPIYDLPNSY